MWNVLRKADIPLRVATVLALAYLFYVFLARHGANRRFAERTAPVDTGSRTKFDAVYGSSGLKILQFYARDGVLYEGKTTVLCYGVLNAASVKIEPPIDGVDVALTRCVEVQPKRDTAYVLTAVGKNGETATASAAVKLQPDPETLPHIVSFAVNRHTVENGKHIYQLGFAFQNGKDVSIDPPVFSPITDSAPYGQFYVEPEKTTTYTLTVTGKFGHTAKKQLTIEVKDP